jgi:hypothetical protein
LHSLKDGEKFSFSFALKFKVEEALETNIPMTLDDNAFMLEIPGKGKKLRKISNIIPFANSLTCFFHILDPEEWPEQLNDYDS